MNKEDDTSPDFDDRMAKVSASYRENLTKVLEDLTALQEKALNQDGLITVADPLGDITHRLAGSAGLFGFSDVGEAADQAEVALHVANQAQFKKPQSDEGLAALDRLLDTLRNALASESLRRDREKI